MIAARAYHVDTGELVSGHGNFTHREGSIAPTLLDYLQVLKRRKWTVLLIVLLVPATAIAKSESEAPTYQGSAQVLLNSQNLGDTIAGVTSTYVDPARVAQTKAELARVPAVLDKVVAAVPDAGLTEAELRKTSSVGTSLGSDFLTFSVKNSSPPLAMRLATAYARAFVDYQHALDTQAIQATLAKVERQLTQLEAAGETGTATYQSLTKSKRELEAFSAVQTPSAQVVQTATEAP